MRKAIFSVILIFSTVSCAAFMEDFGNGEYNEALQQTAVILALTSKPAVRNDLLLGLYYYPVIYDYPSRYSSYLPPPKTLSPIYKSLWIESEIENEIRSYEYRLKSINDMEIWKLKMEAQRLMDDLKREMERAKEED